MIDLNHIGPRIILTFGNGHIYLTESVCLEIIVCAVIAALGIWTGSRLERVPRGKQVVAETIVSAVYKLAEDNLGKETGERYAPYLGSLIVFLIFANSLGLLGLRPITADLNVTSALAVMSFLIIQVSAVKKLGWKGRLSAMGDPYWFMILMNIISAVVLPVTLALRLFGNIFGGMIVVDLWLNFMGNLSMRFCSVPILRCVTGIPLNLFFDIFEPLIQAYIFTVLTAVNLNEALSGEMPETAEKRRRKRLARQEKRRLREEKQEA
ncbi:MAG: F0F1 ATP synthase subunit A [Eubacterium pyruvativorans]|uniref:F0F1 ATP synthase subunit A n=1 Tax=Eubacterium pyruvativorans TaxID=155865 RepID=UPI002A83355E|nr:F0F1 ATP synthase subunit A [Eubacterium pyruvativorans]MDY4049268.1 F0F1 ATP synthase subunit A [Eubacterium pyruvativorans]